MAWYRKAADQGHPGAQTNLGVLYYKGNGVKQDFVEAEKWFNIASAAGYEDAKKNSALMEKLMTPEQIAEARQQASEWKQADQK
ncbi:MAG: hypothetical protein L0H15_05115 [Nitrosospira sp.]|nr:hypothetical protein [Nitrosospira sp.]